MPYTPEQARERRQTGDAAEVKSISDRIDAMLSTREPNEHGEWWFSIDARRPIVDSVADAFADAGWSVRIDVMSTTSLVFKERSR